MGLHYQGSEKMSSAVLIGKIFRHLKASPEKYKDFIEFQAASNISRKVPDSKKLLLSDLQSYYLRLNKITIFTTKKQGRFESKMPIDFLYVPLAIVDKKRVERNANVCEISLKDKKRIKLEDLFSQEDLKDAPEKRVVIFGLPGSGKSTLVSYILGEWAKKNLWQHFRAIFCIRLRNLGDRFYREQKEEYDAAFILQREYKDFHYDFACLLEDRKFLDESLIIMDGYDESPEEMDSPGEFLCSAFEEILEKFPHILVTSRPGSVGGIDSCAEFEILNFDNEQIKDYTSKFLQIADAKCVASLAKKRSKDFFCQFGKKPPSP